MLGRGGLKESARLHGVPHETLRRRVVGTVEGGCKLGPDTVLSKKEEERLALYIVEIADMGFGLTRDDFRSTAYKITEACSKTQPFHHPFNNEMAGRAWLEGFFKRHP